MEALKASRLLGCVILSITGSKKSSIAALSDKHIEIKVNEAGPFGIVPTSSTTAVMAMGDALACALCQIKNITVEDFKKLHPAGTLGDTVSKSVSLLSCKKGPAQFGQS